MNISLIIRILNNGDKPQLANSSEVQQLLSVYNLLYKNTFIQYQSEATNLLDITVQQQSGEAMSFKSIFSDRPKLVFRYNEHHCNTCVDMALQSLIEYRTKIGIENIIILTSYKSARTMHAFIQKNAPGMRVFNTNEDINIPLEKWSTPYFFITDNELNAHLLFIPAKEINGYTKEYLEAIYQKYFK
jgi:hypothetical protein